MSVMYLAKINVNSKIFEVYDSKLEIDEVLNEIYEELNCNEVYIEKKRKHYFDKLGNKVFYVKESKYQFAELRTNSENKVITGKLVRNFNRPTEELDDNSKQMKGAYTNECVSIYFYFDVFRELITFCSRQAFGYNQFTNAFNSLLNLTINGFGFEVFLQKDENVLEEKLKEFKRISKITATLVPPNANEEELKDLRDTLNYIADCKDVNATKYKIELSDSEENPGLKMQAKIMQDTIKAVSKGYGNMNAVGYNGSNRRHVMNSNQDAALSNVIAENIQEDDFNEESKNFIERFIANMLNKINKGAV